MRPVHWSDLDTVVRAMLAVVPENRGDLARTVVARAAIADRYRKHLRCRHPVFGDGSLTAAAQDCRKVQVPARCDRAYLACLGALAEILAPKERFDLPQSALYRSQTAPHEGHGHGHDKEAPPQHRSGLAADL